MASTSDTKPGHKNAEVWKRLHREAMSHPVTEFERAVVGLYNAWRLYAQAHRHRFEGSKVGEDGYLGDPWEAIGISILALLNGETGARIDRGSLDHAIRVVLESEGRPQ